MMAVAKSPARVLRDRAWTRIEEDLRKKIEQGVLKPNDQLRSEPQLMAEYGVGIYDVRKALRRLRQAGLLFSVRRSGVFVADREGRSAAASSRNEGFNVFEIPHGAVCSLSFLIGEWRSESRQVWEEICRGFSAEHPNLNVTPLFPSSTAQYNQYRQRADVFLSGLLNGSLHLAPEQTLTLLSRSEMEAWPLDRRYVDAVSFGDKALGVPVTGTLLAGGINQARTPRDTQGLLLRARSWDEVLWALARARDRDPSLTGLNLHHWWVHSLLEYLMHTAGQLVDAKSGEFLADRARFRRALDSLVLYRDRAFASGIGSEDRLAPDSCCAYISWTSLLARNPGTLRFKPWLFPLGRNGTYLETINLCAISKDTDYPEESRRLLEYMLSEQVQKRFTALPGEHPLRYTIKDRFGGFSHEWRRVLSSGLERSSIYFQPVPGMNAFIHSVFAPLGKRFFYGEIGAGDMIGELSEQGRLTFAKDGVAGQGGATPG